jgi:hypothetical protein
LWAGEPNGHVVIVIAEDHCSSVRPACGPNRRRNDHGDEQEGWDFTTQQEPEGSIEIGIKVRLPICHEERGSHIQACTAQGDGRLPVRDKVPGGSCKSPFLGGITHKSTLDLRRLKVSVHDAAPLAGTGQPVAGTGQPAEPDGMALEP